MPQRGARHRGGAALASCKRDKGFDGPIEVGGQCVDGGAQLQHQRGVDDVLSVGAPIEVACGLGVELGDLGGDHFEERRHQIARCRDGLPQPGQIVALGAACGHYRIDGRSRYDPDRRLRAHQRRLEIEHALQSRPVTDDRAHGRARDERRQDERGGKWVGHQLDWSSSRWDTWSEMTRHPLAVPMPAANPKQTRRSWTSAKSLSWPLVEALYQVNSTLPQRREA